MTLETNSSFSLILNKSKTIFGYYFRGVFGFLFFQCPLVIDPDRVSFFVFTINLSSENKEVYPGISHPKIYSCLRD